MSPCLDPFVRCPLHRRLSLVSGLCQLRESASNLDTPLSLPSTPSSPSSSSRRLCFRIVVYVRARRLSTFVSEIQHLHLFRHVDRYFICTLILSDSTPRLIGIIIFGQRLCPLSLYPRQFNLFLRLLPPPHPLHPSSPATRVCIVFAAFAPKRGSGSSLVRYQYPSLIVFAYGARGPLQYTHVYRRRLCPVVAVPLPCRDSSSVVFGSLCPR